MILNHVWSPGMTGQTKEKCSKCSKCLSRDWGLNTSLQSQIRHICHCTIASVRKYEKVNFYIVLMSFLNKYRLIKTDADDTYRYIQINRVPRYRQMHTNKGAEKIKNTVFKVFLSVCICLYLCFILTLFWLYLPVFVCICICLYVSTRLQLLQ